MITAIDLNRQLDRRKIEIDDPAAHRPLALEFTGQRTAAKPIENLFKRSFGKGRRLSVTAHVSASPCDLRAAGVIFGAAGVVLFAVGAADFNLTIFS